MKGESTKSMGRSKIVPGGILQQYKPGSRNKEKFKQFTLYLSEQEKRTDKVQ